MYFEPKFTIFSTSYSAVLTEAEAAIYIGKSVKTLQRRRQKKQITFIRDGGILYLRKDLDAYLAARRIVATASPPAERKSKYRKPATRSASDRAALLDII